MSLNPRARWACACALALVAAGCQDYNFNPVGRCLIQPGTERVTLSNVSSADVLFVVDDSRSMSGEQADLASNFASFIGNLDNANAARRKAGLEPFDFHIAVTTTSMFWNYQTDARPSGPYTCNAACSDAAGAPGVCCRQDGKAARVPMPCTSSAQCTAGTTCGKNCISPYAGEAALTGEDYCCVQGALTPATAYPTGYVGATVACSVLNTECGTFEKHYNFASCSAGVAANGWPYPQGDFVSWTSGETANPRVLHFDKALYPAPPSGTSTLNASCAGAGDCSGGETCVAAISAAGAPTFCRATCTGTCAAGFSCVSGACQPVNAQGFTSQALVNFFAGNPVGTNGNVVVGTCGSGEETALAAAMAAVDKARRGAQRDTYGATGNDTWDGTTRTASGAAQWFQAGANAKLVLVFVGDEDDCSPKAADASAAVVWDSADGQTLGIDSCWYDKDRPAPLGHKQKVVDDFVTYFMSLGRDVGAGFIFPADENVCTLQTCTATTTDPSLRCCPVGGCTETTGAQSAGPRLLDAAHKLSAAGADVVAGSICDPSFGTILDKIAELVKPPSGLTLPTQPAANEVTLLRIADGSGTTRRVCTGPLALSAATDTLQEAQASGVDWWFTDTVNPAPPSAGLTKFVYINPLGACIANPGETYSADYIGRIPAGGCWNNAAYTPAPGSGETQGDAMCRTILGGNAGSWTCFAGADAGGVCAAPTLSAPGTCICGARADHCTP